MPSTQSSDEVTISWEKVGTGPPLLLVHPSLSDSTIWYDLRYVETLADSYTLLLLDCRGHGRSDKPSSQASYTLTRLVDDVIDLLDAGQIEQAHLMGYSLGGRVALGCGARFPDRFTSLIIGAGSFKAPSGGFDRVSFPGGLETLATQGVEPFLAEWSRHAGFALPAAIESTFRSNAPEVMVPFLRQMDEDLSMEACLPSIDIPALLFAGEHDTHRLAEMKTAADRMPHAELVTIPGGSHLSTLFQTDEILPHVTSFLSGVAEPVERSAR